MSRAPTLLLVNGLVLGVIAGAQFVMDFVGYYSGIGPMGASLYGNLDTLGFSEAHGLALGFAILMVIRRNDGWAGWNIVAALVHTLLGTCNILFWASFEAAGVVPVGYIATGMHIVFAVLELWAFVRRRALEIRTPSGLAQD